MSEQPLPANFDALARVYAPLEHLSFGRALARRRACFLSDPRLGEPRSALVLGDGDGRFTAQALAQHPALALTALDSSAAMLGVLERRVRRASPSANLALHHADARSWQPPQAGYQLVAAHFFFDCFTTEELSAMVARFAPSVAPHASWLVSDFAVPTHRLWGRLANVVVRSLYLAQAALTGSKIRRLPDHAPALRAAGFALIDSKTALGGLLRSELWQR